MMKFKAFILIVLFCSFNFISFSQPVFSTRYDFPMWSSQFIDLAADGGYFFCGQSMTSFHTVIGKVDLNGQLVWAKSIGNTGRHEEPYAMISLSNGNVVVAIMSDSTFNGTFKTYVISLDVNGNTIFLKRFSNNSANDDLLPNNMIRDRAGFTITVYNIAQFRIHVLKLDSLGNRLNGIAGGIGGYQQIYSTDHAGYFLYDETGPAFINVFDSMFVYQGSSSMDLQFITMQGILQLSDGTFLGYGDNGSTNGSPCVFKFNSQMQIIWRKHYQFPSPLHGLITAAQKTGPNTIVFTGHTSNPTEVPFLMQMDTSGNLQRCTFINIPSHYNHIFFSNNCYQNNRLTFIHNESMQPLGDFFKISSVDSSFSPLCNATDIPVTTSSEMLMPGFIVPQTFFVTNDSLVTDSLQISNISFMSSPCNDSTLVINDPDQYELNFYVYPNPTETNIRIKTGPSMSGPGTLTLFDLAGKSVCQWNLDSEKKYDLNISFLPNGMYMVVYINGHQTARAKLIKH